MNPDQTRPVTERTAAPTMISPDRVAELLSTFQALRERGRTLLASLRASVFEMQAQRQRLRQDGAANGHPHEPADQATRRLREEFGMTRREVDVALLLAQGSSNTAVAYRLGISPHTARHHTQRVLDKLGVHSRAAAGARLRG